MPDLRSLYLDLLSLLGQLGFFTLLFFVLCLGNAPFFSRLDTEFVTTLNLFLSYLALFLLFSHFDLSLFDSLFPDASPLLHLLDLDHNNHLFLGPLGIQFVFLSLTLFDLELVYL